MKEKNKKTIEQENFSVVLEDEKRVLPFSLKDINKFESSQKELEKFLRLLEKSMHEVIWYIGTDYIGNEICERFMFSKSGFMEISLGKTKIKAFFPSQKRAEKFKKALEKVLRKMLKNKAEKLIKK